MSRLPIALSLLFCGAIAAGQARAASEARLTPVVRAVRNAGPSVVNIQGQKSVAATGEAGGPGVGTRQVNGMGTGVVIDPRGYILTNHHVVEGVRQINVTLSGGQTYTARVIAHDRETDLAVIRIRTPKPLPVLRIGTSSDLLTGESVVAVGNAFGYENTVTTGVISALHRNVQVNETQKYLDLIQTDASINPGNSGGPLLNIEGEMIGVNVAVRAGAQGIGFAIPVDKALDIATGLISIERLDRNWHGMTPLATNGLLGPVTLVKVSRDSPADTSGLQRGDEIQQIGSTLIVRPLDVERALLGRRSGESVPVQVRRSGRLVDVDLVLSRLPGRSSTRDASPPRGSGIIASKPVEFSSTPTEPNGSFSRSTWEKLGLELKSVSRSTLRKRGLPFQGGMQVVRVRSGSSAEKEGVVSGDILVRVHRWYTTNEQDVRYVMSRSESLAKTGTVRFDIVRGEERFFGHLAVGEKESSRR
ncbi:trypsin-like peptidase domain-containing protein [Adhaeretor mobilis]|nr:trypsin-like peptidase domain-containing protein [Adhaeretor mobilis]